MTTQISTKQKSLASSAPRPSDDDIREYANHLYMQRGSANGHDVDDWMEAQACLCANIPKDASRTRLHHHTHPVKSAA